MSKKVNIIHIAEFNPKIKTYHLLSVALILFLTIVGIPFLIIWFLGMGQYISKRYYENLKCQLSEKHLEFKKGVMFKVEKTIPLENIQDLMFIENPLLKMLGLHTLKIETAGQSNPDGSDMKLIGIRDSLEFKDKVLDQRELLRSENTGKYQEDNDSTIQMIELLKEIRDILLVKKNE